MFKLILYFTIFFEGRLPQELFEIIQIPPDRHPFKYENLWETEMCDFFEDCNECNTSLIDSKTFFTFFLGFYFKSAMLIAVIIATFIAFSKRWMKIFAAICLPQIL
jgi:hypothetical protein